MNRVRRRLPDARAAYVLVVELAEERLVYEEVRDTGGIGDGVGRRAGIYVPSS